MVLIEGVGKPINGSVQKAIDDAGASYRQRFGLPPTHIALPVSVDAGKVNLYGLSLAHPSGKGVVVVGRPARDGHV